MLFGQNYCDDISDNDSCCVVPELRVIDITWKNEEAYEVNRLDKYFTVPDWETFYTNQQINKMNIGQHVWMHFFRVEIPAW